MDMAAVNPPSVGSMYPTASVEPPKSVYGTGAFEVLMVHHVDAYACNTFQPCSVLEIHALVAYIMRSVANHWLVVGLGFMSTQCLN